MHTITYGYELSPDVLVLYCLRTLWRALSDTSLRPAAAAAVYIVSQKNNTLDF